MYESYFNFDEKPFALTPNPRFLFLSNTHNEVYAHLQYGLDSRAGFIEVTGEVGTGKTTILRTLLSRLDREKYRIAFIVNPKLRPNELLRAINDEFAVGESGEANGELVAALNTYLLEENRSGRIPVLVIDEAQNLSGEVLEQIRLLSNLETESDKLIQIILVGQPELRQHLNDHSLRQFNQRIAVRYRLLPLNREETSAYIASRLRVVGCDDPGIFSPGALARIYRYSAGIPRRINLLCDRALLIAYTEEQRRVSEKHVRQAVLEIDGTTERTIMLSPRTMFASAMTVVLLLLAVYLFYPGVDGLGAGHPRKAEARDAAEASVPSTGIVEGCNVLLELWGSGPPVPAEAGAGFDLEREFSSRGLSLLHLRGDFSELQDLEMPLLLPLAAGQGASYLAVTGRSADGLWQVVPEVDGRDTLSSVELDALGVGMGFVPWKDFASIGYLLIPGTAGENVRRLQFLLGLNGCAEVPTSGRYDRATIACVRDFQRDAGLVVDGLVGPRTLMMIYRATGNYDAPRLSGAAREKGR